MKSGFDRSILLAAVVAMFATLAAGCAIDKRGRPWNVNFDAAICGPSACNDSIPCTIDECTPAGCDHEPNDEACTTYPDGECHETMGCIYPCNATSCFPIGSCGQSATCVNNQCVRSPEVCP